MLVLSRKQGTSIVIGSDIRVTVISTSNQRVKLGIEAPASVRVVRTELLSAHGQNAAKRVGDLLEPSHAEDEVAELEPLMAR